MMADKQKLDHSFDEWLDEAVLSDFNVDIPDPSPSWEKVAMRLAQRSRKEKRLRGLRMATVAAAALILGAVIFGKPQESEAFQPLTKFFTTLKGDMASMIYGEDKEDPDKGAKTNPPPEGVGPVMGEGVDQTVAGDYKLNSLEEARKLTISHLPTMGYIPEGFQLLNVKLMTNKSKQTISVTYNYVSGDKLLVVYLVPLNLVNGQGTHINKDQNETVEVSVKGIKAKLIKMGNGVSMLTWNDNEYVYSVSGKASREELLKVAEEFK